MVPVVEISEEQALWYRARRSFLAGDGAVDAPEAVRAVCGIQAQQEGQALLGLSQRMQSRPRAATLAASLTEPGRKLVRSWGQRDTLHIYDANDWPHMVAIRSQWAGTNRQGPAPPQNLLERCLEFIESQGEPVTRKEMIHLMSAEFSAELEPYAVKARMPPERLAASRTLWRLAHLGHLCIAGNIGSERLYAARSHWFPELPWPETLVPLASAATMTLRYLANYGPATPADVAHFFGVRVREAKEWLAEIEEDLAPVSCEGRKNLWIPQESLAELQQKPPVGEDWPIRLLPLWDGLLMGHKDKSLIIPETAEQKRVWRPGSYVAATVLARGRIVAVWTQKKRRKALDVNLETLSGWKPEYRLQVEKEAGAIAAHMGLEAATLSFE